MATRASRINNLRREVEHLTTSPALREPPPTPTRPDIMEFCLSDRYLNLGIMYPRQATLLKATCLQSELFTPYDDCILDEWSTGFALPDTSELRPGDHLHFEGEIGIAPDLRERIAVLQALGMPWFPEMVFVAGRRGGKGVFGAIMGAYVTWNLICMGDPQAEFGIAPGKTLAGLVYAGKRQQARDLQWADIAETIVRAPCFQPYLAHLGSDTLTLATPADLQNPSGVAAGSIQIMAKETTPMAGRGPAAYMAFFDENAHVSPTNSNATSEDLYDNTIPALDQCGKHSFIYSGSSPWQKMGAFYDNYQRGLEVDRRTRNAADPSVLVCQLPSWGPYLDWEKAHTLPVCPASHNLEAKVHVPGTFARLRGAIQEYDEKLRLRELRNPVKFATEYRAQWANVVNAYLNPESVSTMFSPFEGEPLVERTKGAHNIKYFAHGDPAKKHDNFVWMIAHLAKPPGSRVGHVVVDKIRVWRPEDFDGGQIDFLTVYAEILQDFENFNIVDASFDQHQAIMIIDLLRKDVPRLASRFDKANIHEIVHTRTTNRTMADVLRPALDHGQVHAYPHVLLEEELLYLQEINDKVDHPSSGPVQTNDAATCLMVLVERLLGLNSDHVVHDALSASTPSFSRPVITDAQRAEFEAMGLSGRGHSPRRPRVGERKYPGGPKVLPRWAR